MKRTAILLILLYISPLLIAQNSAPTDNQKPASSQATAQPITELNRCTAIRFDDPKGEGCVRTCDTGQMAQCISVALDSKTPPVCNCVKAEGREGVAAYSMCHAIRKDAEGHEWERCNIACDKLTVATCVDAPDYPAPGVPKCTCEKKTKKVESVKDKG